MGRLRTRAWRCSCEMVRMKSVPEQGDCTGNPFDSSAVATMQAALVGATRPGVKSSSLLDLCMHLFVSLGYPEERTNQVHGGPTGYRVGYPERCQDPQAVVIPNMAFGWYLTVAGAKSEELVLGDDQGAGIYSVDPGWPMLKIEYQGRVVAAPDILD